MTLYRERLAAQAPAGELVLLHGWGASSDCWRPALPQLRQLFNITLIDLPGHGHSANYDATLNDFVEALMEQLPARALYLGWSLGGMIATHIAARYPERASALVTFASNASFVQRQQWPAAMPQAEFDDFSRRFALNPERGLRRFDLLQTQGGGETAKSVPVNPEVQNKVLQWLAELDNRRALTQLACPALAVFAANDALVPVEAAGAVSALNSGLETLVLDDAGHCLAQSDQCWPQVLAFCEGQRLLAKPQQNLLDKRRVAASFSKAAQTYDSVADLQRRVADHLFSLTRSSPAAIQALDLGCGTGYSLPSLKSAAERVIALDLAEGMLSYARALPQREADGWVCGDAEDLPLADHSVDWVFSSLSVQWCENIAAVLAEAYRVLKPGGHFFASTLGPDTLFELRAAGEAADGRTHVNRFLDRETLTAGVARSGLTLESWQESSEVLEYRELRELMAELKGLGAHNVNSGRASDLTGKQSLRRFIGAYEQYRNERGLLPATYQVWYLHLSKPAETE